MKRTFKGKTKLMLTIAVCMLFIVVAISSAVGKPLSRTTTIENEEYEETTSKPSGPTARPFRPLFLPSWFYAIVNDDWNYWTSSPDMYAIPTGNVGIGTESPEEKLDVVGTVQMTGFKMSIGAGSSYVLVSDASGVGTWQSFNVPDGHSLDAADGNPVDVVFVDNDGNVVINTMGARMMGKGSNGNVGITTGGSVTTTAGGSVSTSAGTGMTTTSGGSMTTSASTSMTTTVGTSMSTTVGANMGLSVGNDMDVSVGQDLGVAVGGNLDIQSGGTTTISGSSIQLNGNTIISGKLTVEGGIDPPYISFSKETHESIREYAKYVEYHEEVMQFWNGNMHRMEIYVINEDAFYTLTGELIEE